MGVRIHSLAKELGMSSKDLMMFLQTQGHDVQSHMTAIDEPVAAILRDRLRSKLPAKSKTTRATKAAGATQGKSGAKAEAGATSRAESELKKSGRAGTGSSAQRTTRAGSADRRTKPAAGIRDKDGSNEKAKGHDGAREAERGSGLKKEDSKTPEAGKDKGARRGKVRYFPQEDYLQQRSARPMTGGRRRLRSRTDQRGRGRPIPSIPAKLPEKVDVFGPVTVKDLSASLGIKAQVLVKKLFEKGKPVTINQYLDDETVLELGVDLGTEIKVRTKVEELEETINDLERYESSAEELVPRAPVVAFLGHVDHGKTSLLDKIRQANVTSEEEGGITQHLGAYRVVKGDVQVTFIDTPGHKAFTEMRARGANVTDVVVLVVAADDGPMPQTEEAINHARAANVPMVVAINKIDKDNANPQRTKEALSALGLMPVEWNGTTEFVEVSAITGEGIDSLLEILSLEAEILELKANPNRQATGVVLEAQATTQRGVIATVLVKDGTLKTGDFVLCGATHGRVRNLVLNGVEQVTEAGPSVPVQVIGLNKVPDTGDKLYVFDNEKQARQLSVEREQRLRESERAQRQQISLENLFDHLGAEKVRELRLIIKADVRGSIEAITKSLEQLSTDEVKVVILHSGVGGVTQEDIHLASASQAVVIGFHVTTDDRARALAEEKQVDVRHYRVIYEAIEDVRAALESRLAPEVTEEIHGRAEIRQVYRASKIGNIAGCIVTSGRVLRNDKARLIRDSKIIYTGQINSLKRFKEDARDVKEGFECGIKIANYEDIKEGDVVECFVMVERKRTL